MQKIGWKIIGTIKDEINFVELNQNIKKYELVVTSVETNTSGLTGMIIQADIEEDLGILYKYIIELQNQNMIPIWLITPNKAESIQRSIIVKLGVVGIFNTTETFENIIGMISNTLSHLLKNQNFSKEAFLPNRKSSSIRFNISNLSVIFEREGKEIYFTRTEYAILLELYENLGTTLTYKELFYSIWKKKYSESQRYIIANHMLHIRRKLLEQGITTEWLRTVRHRGYKMINLLDTVDDVPL